MLTNHARPYPLGATLDSNGCNFAIHAPYCRDLRLVIFDNQKRCTFYKFVCQERGIKYIYLNDIKAGTCYGYVHEINGEDYYLLDPYTKKLQESISYQGNYSAKKSWQIPKSVVIDPSFDWESDTPLHIALDQTILLETHVKGFTRLKSLSHPHYQGTYLGLIEAETIQYLKNLGVTTLQLMPITAFVSEPHLVQLNKTNYWGYNPVTFMAPEPKYAAHDAVNELKTVIKVLHRNNIEVVLDVVYNHTAEGDHRGPTFNLKALDLNYYIHNADGSHYNYTGCGNSLDLSYQPTLNLVMDTLRYWVSEFHVDGFRFDLASTLGRRREFFDSNAAFFTAIAQDPILKGVKLIAEPWDIGPNGYQLGHYPDGWNECNDKYRDTIRALWRGDVRKLKDAATRIMGSRDLFSAGRWPHKLPVNYITYHDGFTLQDLVSYDRKHNELNGEQNRDGSNNSLSRNYGHEGPTQVQEIIDIREKQKRNMMASLLFSFGIPHLLAVDSLSHTQHGNNNAYCQDNEISWAHWAMGTQAQAFHDWLVYMIQARQKYMVPFIHAFSGEGRDNNTAHWLRPNGENMTHEDWYTQESFALHLGLGRRGRGRELLICINASSVDIDYVLPCEDTMWSLICDTNNPQLTEVLYHSIYTLVKQSVVIFHRQ